jgi:ABC-2 type transport system permease protein
VAEPDRPVAAEYAAGVRTVFRRELEAYFDSPIAYVCAAAFLVLSGTTFMNGFFLDAVADMTPYFERLPYFLIAFIPALAMRTWAEERAQHTLELLMTLPLRSSQVVLGKYLAAVCFYLLVLAGSLPIVVMLLCLGQPDLGLIAAAYLGAALLGGLLLAMGLFASGLTRSQVVAFVLGGLLGFFAVLSGHEKVVEVLDGLSPVWQVGSRLGEYVSVLPHYESFGRGLVGLADLLYFALFGAFFLWLNDLTLRHRRD